MPEFTHCKRRDFRSSTIEFQGYFQVIVLLALGVSPRSVTRNSLKCLTNSKDQLCNFFNCKKVKIDQTTVFLISLTFVCVISERAAQRR